MTTMEEKIFFNHDGVSVSNARFIVNGQTYAMNNVTSVKQAVQHPSRMGPILLILISLIPLFSGSVGSTIIGIAMLAAAIYWWTQQKSIWIVVLSTAAGEAQALNSKDRTYIDEVISALNQSIIHRG